MRSSLLRIYSQKHPAVTSQQEVSMRRKTSQRAAIERILLQESRPLSPLEVLEIGRRIVPSLNLATVYRNLKLLTETGRLVRLSHPILGTIYEPQGKDHHHHFHCRACRRVFDIPGCAYSESQPLPKGFVTESHEVFLFGICPHCASTPENGSGEDGTG